MHASVYEGLKATRQCTYMEKKAWCYSMASSPCSLHIDMTAIRSAVANFTTRRKRQCYRSVCPLVDLLQPDQINEREIGVTTVGRRHRNRLNRLSG